MSTYSEFLQIISRSTRATLCLIQAWQGYVEDELSNHTLCRNPAKVSYDLGIGAARFIQGRRDAVQNIQARSKDPDYLAGYHDH